MAKQTIDISESATQSAQRINDNFTELYNGGTGGSSSGGVVLSPETEVTEIPIQLSKGWLNGNTGQMYADIQSYHNPTTSASAITDIVTITDAQGKYILIPFGFLSSNNSVVYLKYDVLPELPENPTKGSAFAEAKNSASIKLYYGDWRKPYLIIPVSEASVMYRFAFKGTFISTAKMYVVTKKWLQRNNYVNNWCAKKWLMYGDSYVQGGNLSKSLTWHYKFSEWNGINYINKGHNGYGLVKSPNTNASLLTILDSELLNSGSLLDVNIIGITCGRNDYTTGLPIGDIDDMIELAETDPTPQNYGGDVTFMGGLNYLCKWLLEHYMDKKIFFITPWYFVGNANAGGAYPVDFIDAVLEVSGKWGIPCFDAARRSGINVQYPDFRTTYMTSDDSHLNIEGHFRMASGPVAKWLENLFVD